MHSIIEWFKNGSHLWWALLALVVAVDVPCAHSKNPKLNHAAGVLALLVQKILDVLQVSKIPVLGSSLTSLLNIIIGVPAGGLPAPDAVVAPRSEQVTPSERPADPKPPTAA